MCICTVWLLKNLWLSNWSSPFPLDLSYGFPFLASIAILTFSLMLKPPKHPVSSEPLHELSLHAVPWVCAPWDPWAHLTDSLTSTCKALTVKTAVPFPLGSSSHPFASVWFCHCPYHSLNWYFAWFCVFVSSSDWKVSSTSSGVWYVSFRFCFWTISGT